MTRHWLHWTLVCGFAVVALAPATWGAAQAPSAVRPFHPRSTFHVLLGEHVHVTAATTGAALAGRTDEMAAAVRALDANGRDLAQTLGAVYGPEVERRFLAGWRRHIEFFVWYAKGVMTDDPAMRKKAVDGLDGYAKDVSAFLSSANPHLSRDAVADLARAHAKLMLLVIDTQGAKNHPGAYAALRSAAAQSASIADPLGSAMVRQFPDRFGR